MVGNEDCDDPSTRGRGETVGRRPTHVVITSRCENEGTDPDTETLPSAKPPMSVTIGVTVERQSVSL